MLLAAQRLHRIGSGSAAGRDPGSGQSCGGECCGDDGEDGWLPGADAEEKAAEETPGKKSGCDAEAEAEGGAD